MEKIIKLRTGVTKTLRCNWLTLRHFDGEVWSFDRNGYDENAQDEWDIGESRKLGCKSSYHQFSNPNPVSEWISEKEYINTVFKKSNDGFAPDIRDHGIYEFTRTTKNMFECVEVD